MIVAQVLAIRGEDALVRAAPDPGTQTAQDQQVVERQTGAGKCGLPAVRVYRQGRESGVAIEHQGHGIRPCWVATKALARADIGFTSTSSTFRMDLDPFCCCGPTGARSPHPI